MNELLKATLEAIELESDNLDKSFALVDTLIEKYGEKNIASRLYSDIEPYVSEHVISDLFGILLWSTSDNGCELMRTMENWLIEAQSERQIKIALSLEAYPFHDINKMEQVLKVISSKYPKLESLCNNTISSRKESDA